MPDEVILDVTTIEENVTVETTAGDVVEIQVVAPTGPTGATGPAGPNSVTSATTSDGTANLSLSNVSTATATVSSLLTAGHIHGNLAGTLYTHVRTGEAMSKGDPFYISGFHVGSSQPIAMRADAANASKMPAVGVMDADYAINTSSANGIISGTLSSVDTDGYSVNSPIYVANGGGYSNTAGTIPQQVGITERANASTGAFIVTNSKVISFADVSDAQTGTADLILENLTATNLASVTASIGSSLVVGDGDSVNGRYDIFSNTSHFQWYSDSVLYGERSFTITTENLTSSGSYVYKYPVGNGTLALTGNTNGEPDKLTSGTISGSTTFNTTSYTYGTGAAAAHRTALGLTTLATTTPGTNVANFLEFPTSDNLASALTDENGTGGGFVRAEGATLTSPSLVGPVNLTSQDASTADRVMTRDLSESNHMRNVGIVREVHPACMSFTSASGGSAIVNVDGGFSLATPVTANAYSRAALVRAWANYPASTGSNNPCNVPVAFAMCGLVIPPLDANAVVRFVVGEAGSGTPALPSANALSARGFGFEIYWNTTNSRVEIRMFSHDGTSYTTSSTSIAYNASLGRHFSAMVTSDGSGVSKLFYDTSAAGTAPPRVPLTAAITHTAPSSSNYGQPFASAYCINASTATMGATGVRFFSSRLQVGTIY